jgi:hypothetical protein
VFLRKIPKNTSGGHLLLILVYLGINAVITFYDVRFTGSNPYSLFAKRCGWYDKTCSVVILHDAKLFNDFVGWRYVMLP